MTYTREQLFDLVWAKPTTHLAKEFGVSDVAISKACKRHEIPKPPVGYWAMLQHGKKVIRPALPKVSDPRLESIRFEPLPPDQRATVEEREEDVSRAEELKIQVPATLDSPHPLIQRTMKALLTAKPNEAGLCYARSKDCLDVLVAKEQIDRAMRIMDILIKELMARGAKIRVDVPEYGPSVTYAGIDDEKIELRLNEKTKKRPVELTESQKRENTKYMFSKPHKNEESYGTGVFSLSIKYRWSWDRRRWIDKIRTTVEDHVGEVVLAIFRAAAECKEHDRRRAEEERRAAEERRRQAEVAERRRRHEERVKRLRDEAALWSEARSIRLYADAAEQTQIAASGHIEPDSKFARWLQWSRRQADRLDPLAPAVAGADDDESLERNR